MSDHVYKSVEITGSSPDGVQQAIDNALAKAGGDAAQPRLVRGRRHPRRAAGRRHATTRSRSRSASASNSRRRPAGRLPSFADQLLPRAAERAGRSRPACAALAREGVAGGRARVVVGRRARVDQGYAPAPSPPAHADRARVRSTRDRRGPPSGRAVPWSLSGREKDCARGRQQGRRDCLTAACRRSIALTRSTSARDPHRSDARPPESATSSCARSFGRTDRRRGRPAPLARATPIPDKRERRGSAGPASPGAAARCSRSTTNARSSPTASRSSKSGTGALEDALGGEPRYHRPS